jgi:hypothetical protein
MKLFAILLSLLFGSLSAYAQSSGAGSGGSVGGAASQQRSRCPGRQHTFEWKHDQRHGWLARFEHIQCFEPRHDGE